MKYCFGVDIGGTTVKLGLFTTEGEIVDKWEIKTRTENQGEAVLPDIAAALNEKLEEKQIPKDEVEGIGVGVPAPVDSEGVVQNTANLGWGYKEVKREMEELSGMRAEIGNDANVAALGEMWLGAGKGRKNIVMVTLGTGVGSGIVVNGQMVYGCDGFAGELGHVIMRRENGRACGCGRTGCLEAYCSATGVARTAREFLSTTDTPSLLRDMKPEDITSLDVSIAAGKGDELAKSVYEFTGEMLGEACADFAAFSSPEAFIFFGGLTKAGDLIMDPIKRSYDEHVMPVFKGKAQFLISGLDGSSAAVLGASAIGWDIQE